MTCVCLPQEEDSPGYYSTLNWVKHQIPNARINNFRVSDFKPEKVKNENVGVAIKENIGVKMKCF